MNEKYSQFYNAIETLVGGDLPAFLADADGYIKLENPPYMDLHIDRLTSGRIAIAHNYKQNGDVIPDPDMEVIIDTSRRVALPATFQNSLIYTEAIVCDTSGKITGVRRRARASIESFFSVWISNLRDQGFIRNA